MRRAAKHSAPCKECAKPPASRVVPPMQIAPVATRGMTEPQIQRRICACGGMCPRCRAPSTGLRIGESGGRLEREADAIADRVMHGAAPPERVQSATADVQRKSTAAPASTAAPSPTTLAAPSSSSGAFAPGSTQRVLDSAGQALDPATREFFETRFDATFAGVRLHTDQTAAESARAVGARAYTVGSHIVFGAGQFAPETASGRHLLAHELTHVLQQADATQPVLQRASGTAEAGGCAVNMSATDAGEAAHEQIRMHLRRQNAPINPFEGPIPRAHKGRKGKCPPPETAEGNVDLWLFAPPEYLFAEIKPFTAHPEGLAQFRHYALRLREFESRVFGYGLCPGQEGLTWNDRNRDYNFDARTLQGVFNAERQRRQAIATNPDANVADMVDPFPREPFLVPTPLPASHVAAEEQDAGVFADGVGNLRLFFWNNEDGTVLYRCREQEQDEDANDDPGTSEPPELQTSHPLLRDWAGSLQLQPVPSGNAYAVMVSAPIFNALAIGASGQFPYSRERLRAEAGFEMVGEILAVIGAGLLTRGAMSSPQAVGTGATQGVGQGTTTGQLGQELAQGATQGMSQTAQASAAGKATTISSAAIAVLDSNQPDASTLSPQDARALTAMGRTATRLVPVVAAELTPKLYFAQTSDMQGPGVPPPFTSDSQPDELGQIAWDAISAWVPQEGLAGIYDRRELGLLKNAIFYANPAVLGVDPMSAETALSPIGTLRYIGSDQYIVIAHFVAP